MTDSSPENSLKGSAPTTSTTSNVGGGGFSSPASSTTSTTKAATFSTTRASSSAVAFSPTKIVSSSSTTASSVVRNIPAASSNSTGTSSKPAASSGVSTAAAAGIGIGCAIVGALVAIMLSYLFFRKRETGRPKRTPSRMQNSNAAFHSDKAPAAVEAQGKTIDSDLDRFLPQEADDSTVGKKASTLFDQLELHVENYYRDVQVRVTPAMESELSRFSDPYLSEPLVAFLDSTSRPRQLIKHCLAFHVVNVTAAGSENTRSLLPPEILETVRIVKKRQPTPDSGLAFSRWRMLTAYLRPDLLSNDPTLNSSQQADLAVDEVVQSFTRVFAPWAKPDVPEAERIKNLGDIVVEAVKFAVWLFSQPASFKFDWKPTVDVRDRDNRSVVTAPAVLKVTDNRGQALVRPVSIVGPSRTRV